MKLGHITYSTSLLSEAQVSTPTQKSFLSHFGHDAMYCNLGMVNAISQGLQQTPYLIEARDRESNTVLGILPVVFMRSLIFGRFVVSLPYSSWAGAVSHDENIRLGLIDQAIRLTNDLDARYLELRHLDPIRHPDLIEGRTDKALMRLALSQNAEGNWKKLKSEVRTQVRKGSRNGLSMYWGHDELIADFYDVFSRNMRDLGTPVFPRTLFENILKIEKETAEIGIVRLQGKAIAACLAIHGPGLTEVPSAAALRQYRKTAANSFMYWHAIERSIERGQATFDFGRSTPGSSTYVFKRKWGAEPQRIFWQYYLRKGDTQSMRPDNSKFQLAIQLWKRLPLPATRLLGPMIVRGIP